MLARLLVACLCVGALSGKMVEFPDFWYLETFNTELEYSPPASPSLSSPQSTASVCALELQWPAALRLRTASATETQLFDDIVAPLMHVLQPLASRPRFARRLDNDGRDAAVQIHRMVNKFVLSAVGDRSQDLMDALDEETNPKVTVYFRDQLSVLVIEYETRIWNFVIRPPSPLPAWFYSARLRTQPAMDMLVPEDVAGQFYNAMVRLVRLFLRMDLIE